MKLDCKYVLHIPLSKWENDKLIPLDVDEQLNELINLLEFHGFDSSMSLKWRVTISHVSLMSF